MSEEVMNEVIEEIATPSGKELMKKKIKKEDEHAQNSILEESKATATELKNLIQEHRKTLQEMEKFRAEEILKGRSEAGQIVKQKDESPSDYAKRILGGGK